ncbi:MAG: hypothetical protein QM642_07100 [Edaphocola sp.]
MEQSTIFEGGGLDELSKAYLLETTRWSKFLAILGIISVGLMIFGGFIVMAFGSFATAAAGMPGVGIGMGIGFLFVAFMYLYPIYCLFKFSSLTKTGIHTNDMATLAEGLRFQKNMYKFIGIVAIVVLSLYLLIFIFSGIAGMF